MNITIPPKTSGKAGKHIPDELVYERYNGRPLYYQGFAEVVNGTKTLEEIMGQSDIQMVILSLINGFLAKNLDEARFVVGVNETGFHLGPKSNVSSDIVIYDKPTLQQYPLRGKYLEIPPLVVIEVDIQGDTKNFGLTELDYYSLKTQNLLDFGVKEVIWFFSQTKQVFMAKPAQDWTISPWDKEIKILDQYALSLGKLLAQGGWKLEG
jgi:Uma2 family endonuclease